jgi:hypothetical protein
MKFATYFSLGAAALLALAGEAAAQVPSVISYQGRLRVGGRDFSGTGQFKFALVSPGTNATRQATAMATVTSGFITSISVIDGGAGYTSAPAVTIMDATGSGATALAQVSGGAVTSISVKNAGSGYNAPTVTVAPAPASFVYGTFWSNDGTSSAGSEPAATVGVPVQEGLFNVLLGDTTLSNMQPVPASVFTQSDARLRIWFNDGVNGFAQLAPDQRLGSVGYAMMAAQVANGGLGNGSVSAANLASNAVTSAAIVDGTIVAADVNSLSFSNTFWSVTGNPGTTAGPNFLGTTDLQALELHVNGQRALRLEPTANSPNVLGGFNLNSIGPAASGSTISGGGTPNFFGLVLSNTIAADFSTIGGGAGNTIEPGARFATISGGYNSTIQEGSYDASIGNGGSNTIQTNCTHSRICGGEFNAVQTGSDHATIGGGDVNTIGLNARYTTIDGGVNNAIQDGASAATIGGGQQNTIVSDALWATIGGGVGNTISANASYATIPGGSFNTAAGAYSFAAGHTAQANHAGAFVWADSTLGAFASERADQFRVRAGGGARFDIGGTNWVELYPKRVGVIFFVTKIIDTSTGAYLSGGGVWTDSSDRNAKENFTPVDGRKVLGQVAALPITRWNYKAEGATVRHIGAVAQDFHAAFGVGPDDKHIAPLDGNGVALAAIQGLNELVKAQQASLQAQETKIKSLEARLAAIEDSSQK